jgi:hypothetical protein
MSSCLILGLPEVLLRSLLVDWLRLGYAIRLDTAFCLHESRNLFVTLTRGQLATYSVTSCQQDEKLEAVLRGLLQKGTRLDGLHIDGSFKCEIDVLHAYLKVNGAAVRWIQLDTSGDMSMEGQQALSEVTTWCPNVVKLHLRSGYSPSQEVYDSHIVTFAEVFTELFELSLSCNQLTTKTLADALVHCKRLEKLNIYAPCDLPVEVALPTLKSLAICSMSDAVLMAIGQRCRKLESFRFFLESRDSYTDVGVRALLQGCPLLRPTDVQYAKGISTAVRVELVMRSKLTHFYSSQWPGINEELAQGVLEVGSELRAVNFEYQKWVTDATVVTCAHYCSALEYVTLRECHLITNDSVCELVRRRGSKLLKISVGGCPLLTDKAVLAVAEHCPQLREMSCPFAVSDAAVVKLAEGCPELRYVNVNHSDVGDRGIKALAKLCPKIDNLFLVKCPRITMKGVKAVAMHCASLKTVWFPPHLEDQRMPRFVARNADVGFF